MLQKLAKKSVAIDTEYEGCLFCKFIRPVVGACAPQVYSPAFELKTPLNLFGVRECVSIKN
jgi:hypothetical protein